MAMLNNQRVSKIIHGFHSQHTSTHSDTSAPNCGILAIFFAASTALGSTCLCFRVGMGQMIGIPKIHCSIGKLDRRYVVVSTIPKISGSPATEVSRSQHQDREHPNLLAGNHLGAKSPPRCRQRGHDFGDILCGKLKWELKDPSFLAKKALLFAELILGMSHRVTSKGESVRNVVIVGFIATQISLWFGIDPHPCLLPRGCSACCAVNSEPYLCQLGLSGPMTIWQYSQGVCQKCQLTAKVSKTGPLDSRQSHKSSRIVQWACGGMISRTSFG